MNSFGEQHLHMSQKWPLRTIFPRNLKDWIVLYFPVKTGQIRDKSPVFPYTGHFPVYGTRWRLCPLSRLRIPSLGRNLLQIEKTLQPFKQIEIPQFGGQTFCLFLHLSLRRHPYSRLRIPGLGQNLLQIEKTLQPFKQIESPRLGQTLLPF